MQFATRQKLNTVQARKEQGYRLPRTVHAALIASGCYTTNLVRTVGTAFGDHGLILLLAVAGHASWLFLPGILALLVHVVIFLGIVRCQRGLECLTHEGSHYNWSRQHRLNDALVNLLAAVSVFSTVAAYRVGHKRHHEQFGAASDPDQQWYQRRAIDSLDRSGGLAFFKGILLRIGPYALEWWRAVGSTFSTLHLGLLWHLLAIVVPLAAVFGWKKALGLWAIYYLAPLVFLLPVLRFVAEAGEHVYTGTQTVFEATVSNLGCVHRWLIHPHGDGFHLLHHLRPGIPHHQLRRAHDLLVQLHPAEYGHRHRRRTRILQDPWPSSLFSPARGAK